jgi:hypothetical protein
MLGRAARSGRAIALAVASVAVLAASGCAGPDETTRLESLAILPADVAPYHQMTERAVGDYLTQAFVRTRFRNVGAHSTRRLLAGPRNQDLYRRFKDQAKTTGEVALPVARAVANTVNAQGLVYSSLAVSVVGPVEGRVALTLAIFDRSTGRRVWRNHRERGFVGQLGDPGFLQAGRAMADELVAIVPQPTGEDE